MLRRLARELAYGYPIQDYSTQTTEEESVKPLDPVHIAGCLRTERLLEQALTMGLLSLACIMLVVTSPTGEVPDTLLHHRSSVMSGMEAAKMRKRKTRVSPKYSGHFEALIKYALLKQTDESRVSFFNGYFAVDKDDSVARSIFNGKFLSSLGAAPPPVNPSHRDVVELMQQALRQGCRYGFYGDFRHFFHQIRVRQELQTFFGLRQHVQKGGKQWWRHFVWQCLPMGWSWSPLIAQSIGWAVLTSREPDQAPLFEESVFHDPRGALPTFLRLKHEDGFAILYYDNFLVITRREATAKRLIENLRQAEERFNVKIKEGSFGLVNPRRLEEEGIEYLGIRFRLPKEGGEIQWWPDRLDRLR